MARRLGAAAHAEEAERQARTERRQAAALEWPALDGRTSQRTAMIIAAFLLDEAQEPELADWLLCARPEHARTIATGVAVHALRRTLDVVWDVLVAVDAMDLDRGSEWFDDDRDFCWEPEPNWLIGKKDERNA